MYRHITVRTKVPIGAANFENKHWCLFSQVYSTYANHSIALIRQYYSRRQKELYVSLYGNGNVTTVITGVSTGERFRTLKRFIPYNLLVP